ncbi:hypothetical protein [Halobacillus sp. BBL2006]|uniref:hypothetical protein n=1 Tax=Halobacillus sp. BBL2006 TaxID=1543706 RepID=UPI0005423745|nr:hypothetical protein [Halobacillus sp. BBL2006]KHE68536.1 hypothetical protein LD39_14460 [Halobacillus sp. BBL2006]
MKEPKTRRGKVEQTNEAAEIFSQAMRFNKAFAPDRKAKQLEEESESDALLHHYSDKETE